MSKTYQNLPLPVERTTLPNGLEVITGFYDFALPPGFPQPITIVLSFRCGSMHDGGLPGIAHFLEHMMFEGPARDGVHPQIVRLYEHGIDINAETTLGTTNFVLTGTVPELPSLLAGIADMVFEYSSTPDIVEMERGVVLQEWREQTTEDRQECWMTSQRYPENPELHHNTLGTPEAIQAITNTDLHTFHATHYQPGNAAIVVVGPVQHEQVVEQAMRHYLLRASSATFPKPAPLMPTQVRATYQSTEVPASIRFYVPRPEHLKSRVELFLAGQVLSHLPFGLVTNKIRVKERIAYGTIMTLFAPPISVTEIEIPVAPKHFDFVADVVTREVERLAQGMVNPLAWKTIHNNCLLNTSRSISEVSSPKHADWIADHWTQCDMPDSAGREYLLAATPESVAQTTAEHLKPENFGILITRE